MADGYIPSATEVKELRERTGAGVMECRDALQEANGDLERAGEVLRQRGLDIAEKKAHRETSHGLVECYIHAGGRIGAMVEVNCETDFVARTAAFKELAHELAMQVAASSNVLAVSEDDLPSGAEGEPGELVLLRQPYIRDAGKTIADLVKETIAQTGENIRVRRFARFELGH
jgi:elongation factor Ts